MSPLLWNVFYFKGESSTPVGPVRVSEETIKQALEIREERLSLSNQQWLLRTLEQETSTGQSKALALIILNQFREHLFPLASVLYEVEAVLEDFTPDAELHAVSKEIVRECLLRKSIALVHIAKGRSKHCLLFCRSPKLLFFNSASGRIYHFKDTQTLLDSFIHHVQFLYPWAWEADARWSFSHPMNLSR